MANWNFWSCNRRRNDDGTIHWHCVVFVRWLCIHEYDLWVRFLGTYFFDTQDIPFKTWPIHESTKLIGILALKIARWEWLIFKHNKRSSIWIKAFTVEIVQKSSISYAGYLWHSWLLAIWFYQPNTGLVIEGYGRFWEGNWTFLLYWANILFGWKSICD